jgi:hypothetical protein
MFNAPWDLLVGLIFLVAVAVILREWRARSLLAEWARSQRVDVLSARRCWLWRGPYAWRSSKNQTVFYVTVRDAASQIRRAYVRVGSFFFGLISNQVDQVWDD